MFEALDVWQRKAEGKACVDYGFHMIVSDLPPERTNELVRLVEVGIPSFKLFTAYPDRLYVDDATLYRAMRVAAELGAVVCMHAENGGVIDVLAGSADLAPAWTRRAGVEFIWRVGFDRRRWHRVPRLLQFVRLVQAERRGRGER